MLARNTTRGTRNLRVIKNVRNNSTTAAKTGGTSGAVAGGLAGGLVAVGVGFGLYHFSGARAAVNMASTTKSYLDDMKNKFVEKTPEPSAALKYVREYAMSYAQFIPGAKPLLDSAFKDIDKISEKHSDKVDKLVTDTYHEIKDIAKDGITMTSAAKAWDVLQSKFDEIKKLAQDVGGDLLNQHPEIKKQFGDKFDDLRKMADQYGPEAKKQVDEVYKQAQDIAAKGLSAGSIAEIGKLASDKYTELKKKGEEAYSQGFEKSITPLLEKYPEAKKFVEENKDALKNGKIEDLIASVKKAVDSKDLGGLQEYVDKAKETAKSSGLDVEKYFSALPAGGEIFQRIKELRDAAEKHGDEAIELSEKTFNEIKEVLSKRAGEAKKLGEKAVKS